MNLSRPVSEEAFALHRESIVIDATSFFCEGYTDLLERSGVTALNMTVPDIEDDAGGATKAIAEHYALVNSDPKLAFVFNAEDIRTAKSRGDVGLIIGAQNARHMASKMYLVELFYKMGMRVCQIAYNDRNFAADGSATGVDAGLSHEGRQLVEEMNRVGMVVDISHVGPQSAAEAVEHSTKPPIASHSNPVRAGAKVPRNISDDTMRAIADKGGVIGLSPFPSLVWQGGDTPPTVEEYFDIMEYAINLVGIDHVGVGTDKEATSGAYPREVRLRLRRRFSFSTTTSGGTSLRDKFPDGGSPELDGFSSLADFPVLTQGMMDRGFDAESIQKVLGLNFLRVFEDNWA